MKNLNTAIGRLRITAFLEGMSFLIILFVTMPLKYMADMSQPNQIIGMAHGVLFIAYCLMVLESRSKYKWTNKETFLSLLASIIPFGTFWVDHKIFKNY
jgi:integral membrane protein